jgi:hypothetical protein
MFSMWLKVSGAIMLEREGGMKVRRWDGGALSWNNSIGFDHEKHETHERKTRGENCGRRWQILKGEVGDR